MEPVESRAALSLQQPAERVPAPPGEPPRRLAGVSGRLSHPRTAAAVRLAGALLSGLLLYLAFPPVDLPWLAVPAVALLTLVCRCATGRWGALRGLVHGLALFLPLVEWTATIAGPGALLALALLQAAFLALLGAALAVVTRTSGWPLWSAALWVGQEALRDRLPFGGFPWGRLAFSQGDSALTPLAALGGAPLVTFAVALLGGALAWAVVHARNAPVRATAVAAGALVLVLAAALVPLPTSGERARVAVVQGNVPRLGLDFNAQRAAVLDNHIEATRELAADVRAGRVEQPELVIWPENDSDIDPFTDPEAFGAIDAAVKDIGVPVLVGAVVDGPGPEEVSNTGVVWDPQTGPGQRYVKRHPVPFGEYIPYRSLVRKLTDKVDLVPRDFAAGNEVGVLDVGPVRLGDVICFEVAYDDLVRDVVTEGGRLIVVQTNNATFGRSGETDQQLAMGRLRALEHGRTVLVAATSGISAVIAPDGELVDTAPVFTREVLVHEVPVRDAHTLATRLGAGPELALAALGLLSLVFPALRRRVAA
jgi:apolipoprotein N-acyltransferase